MTQPSPFANLRGRLAAARAAREPAAPPPADTAAVAREIIAAGNKARGLTVDKPQVIYLPLPEMRAPTNTTGHIVAPADTAEFETVVATPEAVARKIVEAASLAKAGGPPMPKPIGLAAEIIAAGAKRRNLGKG
jgi:hypothetical protein